LSGAWEFRLLGYQTMELCLYHHQHWSACFNIIWNKTLLWDRSFNHFWNHCQQFQCTWFTSRVTIFFKIKSGTYFEMRKGHNEGSRQRHIYMLRIDHASSLKLRRNSLVCVAVRLYNCIWGVLGFKSRPGCSLSWQVLVVFLSPSKLTLG
jgi:hypothetical protein